MIIKRSKKRKKSKPSPLRRLNTEKVKNFISRLKTEVQRYKGVKVEKFCSPTNLLKNNSLARILHRPVGCWVIDWLIYRINHTYPEALDSWFNCSFIPIRTSLFPNELPEAKYEVIRYTYTMQAKRMMRILASDHHSTFRLLDFVKLCCSSSSLDWAYICYLILSKAVSTSENFLSRNWSSSLPALL